jgi:hypothetical protein
VQRVWSNVSAAPPPARVAVAELRDEFEEDGTAQGEKRGPSGGPCSSADGGNYGTVLQPFAQSMRTFQRKCSRETRVCKTSAHWIFAA